MQVDQRFDLLLRWRRSFVLTMDESIESKRSILVHVFGNDQWSMLIQNANKIYIISSTRFMH